MKEICGTGTGKHISFIRHKVIFLDETLTLVSDPDLYDTPNGLILLLSSFQIVEAETELTPCFDLEKLKERNQAKQKENMKCN